MTSTLYFMFTLRKMKLIIPLMIILFTSIACGPDVRSMDELEKKLIDNRLTYNFNDEPYSGQAVVKASDQIKVKYELVNGLLDGLTYYYDAENKLNRMETYKNGELNGLFEEYYPDGKIKVNANYLNGKKHGKFSAYYPSGLLKEELTYDVGLIKGDNFLYYKDGKVRHHFHFNANGQRHGVWEKFYPNGNPKEYLIFRNGQLVPPMKRYDRAGNLINYNSVN